MSKSKSRKSLPAIDPKRLMVQRIDIDQLAIEQGVPECCSLESLKGNFWPEDEDIDEFIATIRRWRQEEALLSAEKEKQRR